LRTPFSAFLSLPRCALPCCPMEPQRAVHASKRRSSSSPPLQFWSACPDLRAAPGGTGQDCVAFSSCVLAVASSEFSCVVVIRVFGDLACSHCRRACVDNNRWQNRRRYDAKERRRFQWCVIAAASILVLVNIASFLRPVWCADCFFPYGLPFTLFTEGGFAGGGGIVWRGLVADAALL
jgi:hypothetical protein